MRSLSLGSSRALRLEPDALFKSLVQRVGKYIRQLRALVPQDEHDPSRITTSSKKRVGGTASSKKGAADADEPPPDLSDFVDDLRQDVKMTVATLKSVLKLMGRPTSGKKEELIASAKEYLEEHDLWEEAASSKGKKGVKGSDGEMVLDGDDDDDEDKPHHKKKKKRVVLDEDDE